MKKTNEDDTTPDTPDTSSSSSMLDPNQKTALQQLLMQRMQAPAAQMPGTLVANNDDTTSNLANMVRNKLGGDASYSVDNYNTWHPPTPPNPPAPYVPPDVKIPANDAAFEKTKQKIKDQAAIYRAAHPEEFQE